MPDSGQADFVRTFVALEVPPGVKEQIGRAQQEWSRHTRARISWTRTAGIHLTLAFLGDVERKRVENIGKTLKLVAAHHPPITIDTAQTGAFPDWRRPRVIWWGVDGKDALMVLQQDVIKTLREAGFELEERFHPHLTIARVKSVGRDDDLPARARAHTFEPSQWTAKELFVMSSLLKPGGAEYGVLAALPLGGSR